MFSDKSTSFPQVGAFIHSFLPVIHSFRLAGLSGYPDESPDLGPVLMQLLADNYI